MNLPSYKSHKIVRAAKITSVGPLKDGMAYLVLCIPKSTGTHFQDVSDEYMNRHQPTVGGYFVVYADGYESWSPGNAFEEGYTLVESTPDG